MAIGPLWPLLNAFFFRYFILLFRVNGHALIIVFSYEVSAKVYETGTKFYSIAYHKYICFTPWIYYNLHNWSPIVEY